MILDGKETPTAEALAELLRRHGVQVQIEYARMELVVDGHRFALSPNVDELFIGEFDPETDKTPHR